MLRSIAPVHVDQELEALQERIERRRGDRWQWDTIGQLATARWRPPSTGSLPSRYLLHLLITLLLPLSLLLTPAFHANQSAPALLPFTVRNADLTLPAAPLALANGERPVPDSAFAAIDALPPVTLPQNRQSLLAPLTVDVPTRDALTLRSGPGTRYEAIGEATAGELLRLLGRSGDWLQARTASGALVWLAAEGVDASIAQLSLLHEPSTIPAPPPASVATVAEEELSLRDGPGSNYVKLRKLGKGVQLSLISRHGEWFEVQADDGATGWVSGSFLSMEPGVAERVVVVDGASDPNPQLVGSVREASVNLRGGPGTSFSKQAMLDAGTMLELLGRSDDWVKVQTSGTQGWVLSDLIAVDPYIARRLPLLDAPASLRPVAAPLSEPAPGPDTLPGPLPIPAPAPLPLPEPAPLPQPGPIEELPPVPEPAPAPEPVPEPEPAPAPEPVPEPVPVPAPPSDLVGFSLQYQGYPYAWGGESPDVGFDCSGFTRYIYRQYGLELPHNAAAQFNTAYGATISDMGSLAPGDLVFFVNTYGPGITHVGLYIGDGQIIQALSPGYGVGIASIYESYWAEHFYAGIRPGL